MSRRDRGDSFFKSLRWSYSFDEGRSFSYILLIAIVGADAHIGPPVKGLRRPYSFCSCKKNMERKTRQRGTQRRVPLVESPRADKVTTLHLRTSANYCFCLAIIPPWRCRHFVGGSLLRFKGPLAKGAVMRSMTGGLTGGASPAPIGMVQNLRDIRVPLQPLFIPKTKIPP